MAEPWWTIIALVVALNGGGMFPSANVTNSSMQAAF
jgi:hypothetical protein